jgi:TonB-linked SusC/RagA family outer membrane protein
MKRIKLKFKFFSLAAAAIFLFWNVSGLYGSNSVASDTDRSDNSEFLQQAIKVTGKVMNINGEPLPGVNIIVKGTTSGVITDLDGNYTITVPGKESVIEFSFIGYLTESITVGDQTEITISLIEDITQMEEVVVTALGIKREKKALTYSAQNVSADELAEARSLNVVNSLSGKVAGLNFSTTGSGVGSSSRITLRGNRSLTGNNQPLYVIDGVPMDNNVGSTASADIGGITTSDGISNINPEDIESISVLKGASAAALYGTRASNGVIVITTKKGAAGQKANIMVSSNLMFSKAYDLVNFQDKYGMGSQGIYDPETRISWGPEMTGQTVDAWQLVYNPDYSGPATYSLTPQPNNAMAFFETGYNWAKTLSVSMGSEKTQGYFSYTNTDAQGIVPGNGLTRNNLNIRLTSNLTKKLELDVKANYISQEIKNPFNTGENSIGECVYTMPRSLPHEQYKDYEYIDGSDEIRYNYVSAEAGGVGGNPYWFANRILRSDKKNRLIGFASLKYNLLDDLSLLVRTGIDQSTNNTVDKKYAANSIFANDYGNYSESIKETVEMNSDFLLSYNKDLGNIKINLSAGGNQLYRKRHGLSVGGVLSKRNYFSINNIDNASPTPEFTEKKISSLYGFTQVGFNEYLFLDITARNDWSSTLPPDNWSYFYPSVGLTGVFTDMFDIRSNVLTFLKGRVSYAQVGNDTDPYRLYNEYYYYGFNGGTISGSSLKRNENLRPEISTSQEIGIDARFLNNRIGLDFTWFKTITEDQIFRINLPEASSFSQEVVNGGEIENKGIELVLNATVLQQEDFSWNITANYATYKSKVISIMEGRDELSLATGAERLAQSIIKEGGEYGDLYIRGYNRTEDGQIIVDETSGLPEFTSGFDTLAGNFNPDWTGGIQNQFKYKNFTLSFLIDFRIGGEVISYTQSRMAGVGASDITLEGRTDGFVVEGVNVTRDGDGNITSTTPNTTSILAENYWSQVASRDPRSAEDFVFDATNVRLRELVLGYSLPSNVLEKTPFSNVSISLVGRNLFFLVNKAKYFDPEQSVGVGNLQGIESFNIPTTRDYGFNIKLNF